MIDLFLGAFCEVRGAAHYERHGGLKADSDWHVAQGERPTCDGDNSSADSSRQSDDDPGVWRRDRAGFHCTWRGCG
jgi:hypothetical protein